MGPRYRARLLHAAARWALFLYHTDEAFHVRLTRQEAAALRRLAGHGGTT